jgi:hypothetical protein
MRPRAELPLSSRPHHMSFAARPTRSQTRVVCPTAVRGTPHHTTPHHADRTMPSVIGGTVHPSFSTSRIHRCAKPLLLTALPRPRPGAKVVTTEKSGTNRLAMTTSKVSSRLAVALVTPCDGPHRYRDLPACSWGDPPGDDPPEGAPRGGVRVSLLGCPSSSQRFPVLVLARKL